MYKTHDQRKNQFWKGNEISSSNPTSCFLIHSWVLKKKNYMRVFESWYFGLCWNLRLVIIRVIIISWRIFFLKFLLDDFFFFEDYNFCMVKYLSFHNSSFDLRYIYIFNVNGKATVWQHTPCLTIIVLRPSPPHNCKTPLSIKSCITIE